jgi:hypothetical protein
MRFLPRLLSAFLPLLVAGSLFGQGSELGQTLFTVGTTENGRAYLLWVDTDPDPLVEQHFAIYEKSGDSSSPALFVRRSVATLQTDPRTIAALIRRAEAVGEDRDELAERVDLLYHDVQPAGSLSLEEKLSAAIRAGLADPEVFESLRLLARIHPGVALALGQAYVGSISGPVTFEVRRYDPVADRDLSVAGRVSLDPAFPLELPAPGRPVQMVDLSAKAHLNARLRWSSPDSLRRSSLLQYGFNLYRVPRATAVAQGLDSGLPDAAKVRTYGTRVNRSPILAEEDLSASEASNLNFKPELFFAADDNGRFLPGGVPFVDGAQFFYYVAARDILGREGRFSMGTLVTMCDRLPPPPPENLRVDNSYLSSGVVSSQFLEVSWDSHAEDDPDKSVVRYHVYRWQSIEEMHQNAGNPLANRVTVIDAAPGLSRLSYRDDGPLAPNVAADAGKTFLYTVRAEDSSLCGEDGNLSPNSAPAFGALRFREGPGAAGGSLSVFCMQPIAEYLGSVDMDWADTKDRFWDVYLYATRGDPDLIWAEYAYDDPAIAANRLGRGYFGQVAIINARVPVLVPGADPKNPKDTFRTSVVIFCRVGSRDGSVSPWVASESFAVGFKQARLVGFRGNAEASYVSAGLGCDRHLARGRPESGGLIRPLRGQLELAPRTREWKLYRRVDDGPLTLIQQGENSYSATPVVLWSDVSMPSASSSICYYGQLFDEHGNAGPLTPIGCADVTVALEPAMLDAPKPLPSADPQLRQARLSWFASPHGIERFEVWVSGDEELPDRISPDLSLNLADPVSWIVPEEVDDFFDYGKPFKVYQTPRLAAGFGNGPEFSVDLELKEGIDYTFFVVAVGPGSFSPGSVASRASGPRSNGQIFRWAEAPVAPGPVVPWPALGPPRVSEIFDPRFRPEQIPATRGGGVGLRIGEVYSWLLSGAPYPQPVGGPYVLPPQPLANFLYREDNRPDGRTALPYLLYRYQVPSELLPTVSGAVVQVSPSMRGIVYEDRKGTSKDPPSTVIHDTFVMVVPTAGWLSGPTHAIYALDTQPVLQGAAYRYLLVRMSDDGEIEEIFRTDSILIQ